MLFHANKPIRQATGGWVKFVVLSTLSFSQAKKSDEDENRKRFSTVLTVIRHIFNSFASPVCVNF